MESRAVLVFLTCAAAIVSVIGAPSGEEASGNAPGFAGPIDLSHPFRSSPLEQEWPNKMKAFTFTKMVTLENETQDGGFIAFNEFCMAEHTGTHLDAPYHFNKAGWKLGQIPLTHFLVPGVLIDASEAAAADRDLSLGRDALDSWEREHGRVPQGSVVLVRFGWSSKYGDKRAYFGSSASHPAAFSHPGVSKELAEALVERKIVGLGVDTPSVDAGSKTGKETFTAHRAITGANIYILENVNLDAAALPPKGFTLIVMPVHIEQGSGAPVRILAVPRSIQFW